MEIVIFDIDGTIADANHRKHFIEGKPKNWNAFLSACEHDDPIPQTIEILRMLHDSGKIIVFFTGRSDKHRQETVRWLRRYVFPDVSWDINNYLYMREDGDFRCDAVVKQDLLDHLKDEYKIDQPPYFENEEIFTIWGCFDDRKVVTEMWNRNKIFCFDVAQGKGDF